MRLLPRLLIIAAMSWLAVILFMEGHKEYNSDNAEMQGHAIIYFGAVVLLAVVVGTMVALAVIPMVGDWMGHFFYNPDTPAERDPHMVAQAKIAQGDYQGAIEEYQKIYEADPTDRHCISEIAHIYCDKLEAPASAIDVLEQVLQGELAAEDAAFFTSRLVDVYWNYLKDAIRARQLLIQITEILPDSKFSANAMHRLHEIDRELAEADTGFAPPA